MLTPQQRLAGLSPDQKQRTIAIAQAMERGQIQEAQRGAVALLALAPTHPEVLRLFAMLQQQAGNHRQALDALLRACAQRPDDPMIYNALGQSYEGINDLARSRDALQRACELGPDLAVCSFNYARRLIADNDSNQATAPLQRVLKLNPEHPLARSMLANVLRTAGRNAEAEAQFRRIIAAAPTRAGHAWWGLAMLKPMPLTHADISTLQRILKRADVADNDRVAASSALAMAFEHSGDYAQAFAAMQAAHVLARRHEPHDAADFTKQVDAILAACTPRPQSAQPAIGDEVIFIASLPRSGSTLIEQILASHSQIQGTSELHDLGQVLMAECEQLRIPFTQLIATHRPDQWHTLGQRYLQRTERWRRKRPRFTDKMPANWMYIGTILSMLPNARVVVCRRDPLETCLACYRYLFARHPYTHDFSDLAKQWQVFDRSIAYWKRLYPDRVREQSYEALQADTEAQIRELLAFCDLPFEDACLNFHTTQRVVTTPSAAQVREPIRRDTARAGKYGALLDPLRLALGMPPFADR